MIFSGWTKSSCLPSNWSINVYCFLGTERFWFGNWNRHVCFKGRLTLNFPPDWQELIKLRSRIKFLSVVSFILILSSGGAFDRYKVRVELMDKTPYVFSLWRWTEMVTVSFLEKKNYKRTEISVGDTTELIIRTRGSIGLCSICWNQFSRCFRVFSTFFLK